MKEINTLLLEYVPKSKREAIVSIYHDEDGYWAYVENGYKIENYYSEHTIHEDTLTEFRRIFKYIVKDIEDKKINNLKRIRESKGLSQSKLSESSGVNLQMIQKYEQGVKDINKAQGETLYKLAQALNCNVEDLLNIEEA